MAGLDVGHDGRWEYVLLGEPLADVAVAESEAGKGELVISAGAHALLHPDSTCITSAGDNHRQSRLSCGCKVTVKGYFCVSPPGELQQKSSTRDLPAVVNASTKLATLITEERLSPPPSDFYERFMEDVAIVRDNISSIVATSSFRSNTMLDVEETQHEEANHVHIALMDDNSEHLSNEAMSCITDSVSEIIRHHTHHATRKEDAEIFSNRPSMEYSSDEDGSNSFRATLPMSPPSPKVSQHSMGIYDSFRASIKRMSPRSSVLKKRRSLKDKYQEIYTTSAHVDSFLLAEIREVVVLFINVHSMPNRAIKTIKTSIPVDSSSATTATSTSEGEISSRRSPTPKNSTKIPTTSKGLTTAFRFLDRNALETRDDEAVLDQFQHCFEVMVTEFHKNQGHIRQFIVDDKGTVAIGTFGLRGSVNSDNAASAVDTAYRIIESLEEIGISASIGITSGKVYCGLVGSPDRHEYAVMGPSVNLSARLMGKAPVGGIMCDSEIKLRDRVHKFQSLGEVQAKGYSAPVPIFKPLVKRSSLKFARALSMQLLGSSMRKSFYDNNNSSLAAAAAAAAAAVLNSPSSSTNPFALGYDDQSMFGRDEEFNSVLTFLAPSVRRKDLFQSMLFVSESDTTVWSETPSMEKVFDAQVRTSWITIGGLSGTGKTFFLHNVSNRLSKPADVSLAWNVVVFRASESIQQNISEPLRVWRSILLNIGTAYTTHSPTSVAYTASPHHEHHRRNTQFVAQATRGLTMLFRLLPSESQVYLPLLSTLVPSLQISETEASKALQGARRLAKVADLIYSVVTVYQRDIEKIVILDM